MKGTLKKLASCLLMLSMLVGIFPMNISAATTADKAASYEKKYKAFIADKGHKNKLIWGNGQKPKVKGATQGTACFAYASDFAKKVYNKGLLSGAGFTEADEIQTGDILHFNIGTTAYHWIVVLTRDGNKLYTAEGNYAGRVSVTNDRYYIKSGKLYENISKGVAKARPLATKAHKAKQAQTGLSMHFLDIDVAEAVTNKKVAVAFSSYKAHSWADTTNASMARTIKLTNATPKDITKIGLTLFDEDDNKIGYFEGLPKESSGNTAYVWFEANEDLGVTLEPQTDYGYQFFAVVKGQTFTNQKLYFTTK